MRILLVCTPCLPCRTDLEYGGLERIAAFLAEGLAKKHEVTLIAGKGSKVRGVELITPVESRYSLPGENREMEMWLKSTKEYNVVPEEYDVIDCHTHKKPPTRGENIIWSIHDYIPEHPLFNYMLVARSKFHANFLSNLWGYEVTYAYNCINAEEFKFKRFKKDYFLFLSRITRGKGVFNLVEIAKQLQDQHFIIAGEDRVEYGINPNELVSLFKQLPDNCEYLGTISDREKKRLLANAKALLLPYDNSVYQEVFGLIILEALASGTPVFAINNGAVPEILNGTGLTEYGYVAYDVRDLVNAIKSFINDEFGFEGYVLRKRAKEFSPDAMVKRYEEIYLNTLCLH